MSTASESAAEHARLLDLEPTGSVVIFGDESGGLCLALAEHGWDASSLSSWQDLASLRRESVDLIVASNVLDQVEDGTELTAEVAKALVSGGRYVSLGTPTIGAATIEGPALQARVTTSAETLRCPTLKHLVLELREAGLTPTAAYSQIGDELSHDELTGIARQAGIVWPGLNPSGLYRYFSLRRQALGSSRRMINIIPATGLQRDVLFWMDTTTELWAQKPAANEPR